MQKYLCLIFLTCVILKVSAVPPSICRAGFRWDDCGKPPKAVMYYWKEGSRCEIGLWKGCLPNPNMFADEYECINTCVFVDRPLARTETETETPEPTTLSGNDTDVTGNDTSEETTAESNEISETSSGNESDTTTEADDSTSLNDSTTDDSPSTDTDTTDSADDSTTESTTETDAATP